MNDIDWSVAPKNAVWHAFNPDGAGYWYDCMPYADWQFGWHSLAGTKIRSNQVLTNTKEWKSSLTTKTNGDE